MTALSNITRVEVVARLLGASIASIGLAYASPPPVAPVPIFIESLTAPGYGYLVPNQCRPHDLQCIGAVEQNSGPVPPAIIDAFKRHFSSSRFLFVDEEAKAARTVIAAIKIFSARDQFGKPSCIVSGSITLGKEISDLKVTLDDALRPPYGPNREDARRAVATKACLGAIADKLSE